MPATGGGAIAIDRRRRPIRCPSPMRRAGPAIPRPIVRRRRGHRRRRRVVERGRRSPGRRGARRAGARRRGADRGRAGPARPGGHRSRRRARARSQVCGSGSRPPRRWPTAPACRWPACRRCARSCTTRPTARWPCSTRAAARCSPRVRACRPPRTTRPTLAAQLPRRQRPCVGDGAVRYRTTFADAGLRVAGRPRVHAVRADAPRGAGAIRRHAPGAALPARARRDALGGGAMMTGIQLRRLEARRHPGDRAGRAPRVHDAVVADDVRRRDRQADVALLRRVRRATGWPAT